MGENHNLEINNQGGDLLNHLTCMAQEVLVFSPFSLPFPLEGYGEWLIALLFFFFFFLMVLEGFGRRSMKRKRLAHNPSSSSPPSTLSHPQYIPFLRGPMSECFELLYNLMTGKNDPANENPRSVYQQNMKSEQNNPGCYCRQYYFFLSWPMVVSWDPDHFREVLTNTEDYGKVLGFIKSFDAISNKSILYVEGEEWKDQHRLIHPAFQFSHLKNQIPKFNVLGQRFVSKLGEVDGPVEMMPWTSKATLDGLSMVGFGMDMGALLDETTEAYDTYTAAMEQFEDPFLLFPYVEDILEFLPIERSIKAKQKLKLYLKYLSDLVGKKRLLLLEEERSGREREGKDILDVLIAARGDEDDDHGLSDEELIQNVNIFFIAGHEPSASTLAFATHMLAEHPEIQEHLFQEIQNIIGDRAPTSEDIKKLSFLNCYLKEVQRLFPTALGVMRNNKGDTILGNYHIQKGDLILLDTYTLHRHPKHWEKPHDFWPERFLPENSKGRHPFSFTPFSAGSRACIGKNFALLEMKILIIYLVQTFKVVKNPEDKNEKFQEDVGPVLRPPAGATVILEKRK